MMFWSEKLCSTTWYTLLLGRSSPQMRTPTFKSAPLPIATSVRTETWDSVGRPLNAWYWCRVLLISNAVVNARKREREREGIKQATSKR